jgi:hypothetical protein
MEPKDVKDKWLNFHRVATIALSCFIMISSWFLNDVYSKMKILDDNIQEIRIWRAETQGNRFSSQDWTAAKTILDADKSNLDRRITRLEESIPPIRESLIRIETSVNKLADNRE